MRCDKLDPPRPDSQAGLQSADSGKRRQPPPPPPPSASIQSSYMAADIDEKYTIANALPPHAAQSASPLPQLLSPLFAAPVGPKSSEATTASRATATPAGRRSFGRLAAASRRFEAAVRSGAQRQKSTAGRRGAAKRPRPCSGKCAGAGARRASPPAAARARSAPHSASAHTSRASQARA